MSLETLTRNGLRKARTSGKVVSVSLERGLQVRLAADPDRAVLLRKGVPASEGEARAVAAALGWDDPKISSLPIPGQPPGLKVQPSDPDDGGIDLAEDEDDTPPWNAPAPPPLWPAGLPERFHALYTAAASGTLPTGAMTLKSGLITDLAVYVLAWAAPWPRDQQHIERRLDEALEAI